MGHEQNFDLCRTGVALTKMKRAKRKTRKRADIGECRVCVKKIGSEASLRRLRLEIGLVYIL
jgi:hypothetical protein